MKLWKDVTYRSSEVEIMDDLDMSGELLIRTLDQIAKINKYLGGNRITLSGVKALLRYSKQREISIVDVGCGNGDMLRELAKYGREKKYTFNLIGIDANQATIDYAVKLSADYPEIKYVKEDVLSPGFQNRTYDIALSTLFLHHFEDEIAQRLLNMLSEKATRGVVINDLHRHPMAYLLFKAITVFSRNEMVKTDGLISILRGFTRNDLDAFAQKINYKSIIRWRWAFRYQWIIKKQ